MNVDKENTMRVLKGHEPFPVYRWQCRLGLHRWSFWKEPMLNEKWTQYRKCLCCNKHQFNQTK